MNDMSEYERSLWIILEYIGRLVLCLVLLGLAVHLVAVGHPTFGALAIVAGVLPVLPWRTW